jgi:hypothetical protein
MATLNTFMPTLADIATRLDPDNSIAQVIELLNQTNPILEDMAWIEGNLPTGHKTTIRSGLPTGTWRKLNYGVQPEKSTTVQVTDTTGMLESYAEVDVDLVKLNGNSAAFRLSEDRAFIEGMNQTMATTLFYGDASLDPEKFTGIAARYSVKSGVENGENILLGGGSGSDNTSIYLVVWGPNTIHGIYPKGSTAGLQVQDLGQDTVYDAAGGRFQAFRTHYKWDCGITLRDWRYVVRIANIDVSDLTKNASAGADLIDLLSQAMEIPPNLNMGRAVFYANRTITSFLRRQIANKIAGSTLTMDQVAGKQVLSFDGVPFRRTDALLNTEATIS